MIQWKELAFCMAIAGLSGTAAAAAANHIDGESIALETRMSAIRVNGETLDAQRQEALVAALLRQGATSSEALRGRVRYLMARDIVLRQEAKRLKIDQRPDVKSTIAALCDQVLIQMLLKEHAEKNPITEKELKDFYEAQKKAWGTTEVRVRHILVKDEETANKVLGELNSGASFAKLVKEKSLDTEENKKAEGIIDWTSPASLGVEIGSALSAMSPGQLAATPVRSRFGWHVLKLEGRRPAEKYRDFKTNKAALKEALKTIKTERYVQGLMQKAEIKPVQGKTAKSK